MAFSKNLVLYVVAGIASAIFAYLYYSAPASDATGAYFEKDIQRQASNSGRVNSDLKIVDSPTELEYTAGDDSQLDEKGGTNSESVRNRDEQPIIQIDSFEAHMEVPGARAETYLLVGSALQMNHLLEFQDPEQFDGLAATLEQSANTESYEKAGEYTQAFNSMVTGTTSSVIVSSVSCGGLVCMAKFQSPNTADMDQFLDDLSRSAGVPMYAKMEMPAEASGGYDIRRVIFTNDPSANAFEMPPIM